MSRRRSVTFFYDFASPFAYLGSTQIERVAAGARIAWHPILLGGLFRELGTPDVPLFAMSEPRRRYQMRDLLQWAAHWGVPFAWPSRFPMNTVTALRMVLAARDEEVPTLTHAFYRAFWASDRDLADPGTLVEIATRVGLDGAALLARTGDPAVKARLRDNTDAAARAGVFGVPSFLVGDDLFWGQDRLHFVERALRKP